MQDTKVSDALLTPYHIVSFGHSLLSLSDEAIAVGHVDDRIEANKIDEVIPRHQGFLGEILFIR